MCEHVDNNTRQEEVSGDAGLINVVIKISRLSPNGIGHYGENSGSGRNPMIRPRRTSTALTKYLVSRDSKPIQLVLNPFWQDGGHVHE